MAASHVKLLAAAAFIAGIAWVMPVHDDGIDAEPGVQAVVPEFDIRVRRSSLLVAGHTASAAHEDALRRAVANAFPELAADFEFRPLGLVPDWWTQTTTDLVPVLATMTTPGARLHSDALQVSALVADENAARARLRDLPLPADVQLQTRFVQVVDAAPADELCARQFRSFKSAAIRFEESGTRLRDSAYPALDRIALLADACRNGFITVTGHTDASGNPDWNRQLSLKRAQTVVTHLEERGIDPGRMLAEGAGSSVPVADNATRYGRSMNRRIDVEFSASR